MPGDDPAAPGVDAVCRALADEECRCIFAALDVPMTAPEVANDCDLPQTTTYRKLEHLHDAELVAERPAVRRDGHHATAYVRDVTGVFVAYDGEGFEVTAVTDESPDERLARLWSALRNER